jgi:hypothetical protein
MDLISTHKTAGLFSWAVPDTNWSKVRPDCCGTLAGAGIECSEGRPHFPAVSFPTCQHRRTCPCCSCKYCRDPAQFAGSVSTHCVASNPDRREAIFNNKCT